jgi:hypothetical protein
MLLPVNSIPSRAAYLHPVWNALLVELTAILLSQEAQRWLPTVSVP